MAPVALEAEVGGLLVEVPLAGHGSGVTRRAKDFRDGGPASERVAPGLVAVEPGQERDARAVALGGVVELGEAQAVFREGIEMGRVDFGSVATEIGEAEVVRHDEDDVGPALRSGGGG